MSVSDELTDEHLSCMEVRGGNVPADVGLIVPGLRVHVLSRPYKQAAGGGDVHFVSSCGTGRITRLLIADVAGHGQDVNATARVLHELMYRYVNHIDQRQFVQKMNGAFGELSADGQFATAIVATYFAPGRELSLINAGHPPPMLYRAATKTWELLDDAEEVSAGGDTNFPLGVLDKTTYEQIDVRLEEDDIILCYTDSLPEARDKQGALLGYKRLLELTPALLPDEHSVEWLKRWLDGIEDISPGGTLADDLTVLLIRATGGERSSTARQLSAGGRLIGNTLLRGLPFPWPEWSVKNLLGVVFPWVGRKK